MATRTKPTTPPVDPKVARLYEATGHYGPWTSSEYNQAFPPMPLSRDPDPDPPAEVAELAEARDLALAKFERADTAWREAVARKARAQESGQVRISNIGEILNDPSQPRKLRVAEQEEDDARGQRDVAAEELKRVSKRWHAVQATWRRQLITDAYEANQQ